MGSTTSSSRRQNQRTCGSANQSSRLPGGERDVLGLERLLERVELRPELAGFGVGYLYPTYSALKLLDRKVIGPEDVTLWLTYFIVAYSLLIGENTGLVSW